MRNAIDVSGLTKSYGKVEALRGVSFEVAEGEVFGLLGPNGAGKTTTVEILEGYRHVTGATRTCSATIQAIRRAHCESGSESCSSSPS